MGLILNTNTSSQLFKCFFWSYYGIDVRTKDPWDTFSKMQVASLDLLPKLWNHLQAIENNCPFNLPFSGICIPKPRPVHLNSVAFISKKIFLDLFPAMDLDFEPTSRSISWIQADILLWTQAPFSATLPTLYPDARSQRTWSSEQNLPVPVEEREGTCPCPCTHTRRSTYRTQ